MNKKILMLLLLILVPFSVKATCSEEENVRISKLANNITDSVEYNENTNTFKVTFLNLTGEFLVIDSDNNKTYQADFELVINNLQSGVHNFKIYDINGCFSNEVATKIIKIPFYNKYYKNKECDNYQEYAYCSKWLKKDISYDVWKSKVSKYKEIKKTEETKKENDELKRTSNFLILLYVEYYYIFLPIIIISFVAIIYLKDKSDSIIYRKNKGEDITL